MDCLRRGDEAGATRHWQRICALQPDHAMALTQLGQSAFRRGDAHAALDLFRRAAAAQPGRPRAWVNVAVAAQRVGDGAAEARALKAALERDPYDMMALYLRGAMHERQGNESLAAASFGALLQVASQQSDLPPELQAALQHAQTVQDRYRAKLSVSLDAALAPALDALPPAQAERFRDSVDIFLGRKRRFDAQPMRYFVPRLPAIEFFERSQFPWLADVEACTEAVRAEFDAVLASGSEGFTPYIQYGSDEPVAQWQELNHNPSWSALHLVKDGQVVSANAERCPQTMAMWRRTPSPDQPGRTPVALFSALQPRTHIPAHVGASNCRLLVHLR